MTPPEPALSVLIVDDDKSMRASLVDLLEAAGWLQQARRDGRLQSWSLDLIQGLPGQSLAGWREQLQQAIALQPPHLSVYDLIVRLAAAVFGAAKFGFLAICAVNPLGWALSALALYVTCRAVLFRACPNKTPPTREGAIPT